MAVHTAYDSVISYITKDGSEIRELMHPKVHGNRTQSLAEATVPAGCSTFLHRHRTSEEIYHIQSGTGYMMLDGERFTVKAGDTIWIPAGALHSIQNAGQEPLRVLCCCAPPYDHEDTLLMMEETNGWPADNGKEG